jgi:hypothetical protein
LHRLAELLELVQHGSTKQATWYTAADAAPVVETLLTLDDVAAGPIRVTQSRSDPVE